MHRSGGNAGLALGISFATIAEWIEFIVVAIVTYGFVMLAYLCGRRGSSPAGQQDDPEDELN